MAGATDGAPAPERGVDVLQADACDGHLPVGDEMQVPDLVLVVHHFLIVSAYMTSAIAQMWR
jgi:hypothetical protein